MDTSEAQWPGMFLKIPQEDCDESFADWQHGAFPFLSASLKGPSRWWSTAEKEASTIVNNYQRLD